jgi:hypothetical protein
MKKVILSVLIFIFSMSAFGRNTPCSGKKGGVSHCQGTVFICNDGTKSRSKKKCS